MEEAPDSTVRPWADLVPDLLRHISGSLRDAADFVRFHAVCRTWRDTLTTPSSHYPSFLPWLLAPGCYHRRPSIAQFRSIFSKTTWCAPGTYSPRNRWLGTEDGTGTWLLTAGGSSPRLVDPFTGAATALPPFPDKIRKYFMCTDMTDGIVCSDGTVVLYAVLNFNTYFLYILTAVLRPGDASWTEGDMYRLIKNSFGFGSSCAAAYHRGSIVFVDLYQMYIVKMRVADGGNLVDVIQTTKSGDGLQPVPRPRPLSIHVFESRGELLAACVLLTSSEENDGGGSRDLAGAISLWIYALESETVDGKDYQRWVRRDGRSLMNDRVLFLGRPTSFAVDATRFPGEVGCGGCAYFVLNSRDAGWIWRIVPEASRVYRYSFEDGSATEVEELPLGTGRKSAVMWIAPRPSAMAPAHEIRERPFQAPNSKHVVPYARSIIRRQGRTELGPPFKVFVGNLPSWVDSHQLRQFFENYADVTDERVVHDTRTGRSLGYGFVTMATIEEPEEVFAALDGENFYGHVLRVKKSAGGRRPKGPFVMPLLAPNKKADEAVSFEFNFRDYLDLAIF